MRVSLRKLAAAAALATSLSAHAQGAAAPRLPDTTVETLDEKTLSLPRDLPAERTLVLIAFERDQRGALETWVNGLGLAGGKTPWIELVVVGPQNAFVHTMIVRGMRREAGDGPMRTKLQPIFSDQDAFAASMGLSAKSAYAAVVDRAGHVIATSQGDYSSAKAQALLASVKP